MNYPITSNAALFEWNYNVILLTPSKIYSKESFFRVKYIMFIMMKLRVAIVCKPII